MKNAAVPLVSRLVDELGRAERDLAKARERVNALKDNLVKAYGVGSYEGATYRVTISIHDRAVTDWRKVAVEARIPVDLIAKYTRLTDVTRVNITSRKGQ